ncbi:MAG: DUF6588 family protein [Balneolaceae bacterium]|nr:DUF6588 family protein [Balneolaceae bacterium]
MNYIRINLFNPSTIFSIMTTYYAQKSPKNLRNKASVFFSLLLVLLIVQPARAQLFDSGKILRAGSEDANLLLREYLKPFGGGFGADLNSGWFTSAKPLRKFGFDLRISGSMSFVPDKDQIFNVNRLNLKTVSLLRGPSDTPTAFGEDNVETSTLGTVVDQEEIFSFDMPDGSGYHFVPAPMAQFSMGLPGHTQVSLRYTPTVTIDSEYQFRVFGIGGMVGLNHLLFNNHLPLDLSLQAGLMDLHAGAKFDVRPLEDDDVENTYPDSHWNGQGLDFNSKSFAANLLAGKQVSVLSLFVGVGYQYASTKIKTRGSYPIVVPKTDDLESGPSQEIQSVDDPINFVLDGKNKFHILGGFHLKIAFISISAAYTIAVYPTLRAGVGITFDS